MNQFLVAFCIFAIIAMTQAASDDKQGNSVEDKKELEGSESTIHGYGGYGAGYAGYGGYGGWAGYGGYPYHSGYLGAGYGYPYYSGYRGLGYGRGYYGW